MSCRVAFVSCRVVTLSVHKCGLFIVLMYMHNVYVCVLYVYVCICWYVLFYVHMCAYAYTSYIYDDLVYRVLQRSLVYYHCTLTAFPRHICIRGSRLL